MAKKAAAKKPPAPVPSIRSGLSDIVNDLNIAKMRTTDPQQALDIQKTLRILFLLWEYVIYEQMDKKSSDYKDAIAKVSAAKKAASDAVADLNKIATAINKATQAAKAVDKIVGLALKLV